MSLSNNDLSKQFLLTVLNINPQVLTTKIDCDQYKSNMEVMMTNKELTKRFIEYSLNDVECLEFIRTNFIKSLNNVLETINVDKKYIFTNSNTPKSFGSSVSKIISKIILNSFTEDVELFEILNQKTAIDQDETSSLVTGASVKTIGKVYGNSTGIFNAIIAGGRNINEQPDQFKMDHVLDADLASCYGTALKDTKYPIGLPFVYAYRLDAPPKLTLKQFLKLYENELVDGLYTITVTGKLSFQQDLIYSKIINPKTIKNTILKNKTYNDINTIDGDFVLLKKEIINVTSDILKALRRICSSNELKEIYNLEVVTAIYYKKSLLITDKKEFLNKIGNDLEVNQYKYCTKTQSNQDKRTRAWTYIDLEDVFGKLIEKREHYKAESERFLERYKITLNREDLENHYYNESLQGFYKNITNTAYGGLASKYFNTCNAVVANNITAKARLNVWLMKIVLQGRQTITDGCIYNPKESITLEGTKLPSLETFSNKEKLISHRSVKRIKEKIDWDQKFKDDPASLKELVKSKEFNQETTKRVKAFWDKYQIEFECEIEHKD